MKAMRVASHLGENHDCTFPANMPADIFVCSLSTICIFFQDISHIISKLRTRLLETSVPMRVGNFKISLATLKCILSDEPSIGCFIKKTDICSDDKMDVDAGKRICSKEVINRVTEPGLKFLLQLMNDLVDAFENVELSASEKIKKIWIVCLSLRGWRQHIKKDQKRKMKEFIALPTYIAIEINAHHLINFYRHLRETQRLELFKYLHLLSSQICEDFFRKLRSMNTFHWTCINMSMLDVCYKIKRINAIYELEKNLENEILLARYDKKPILNNNVEYLDDNDIKNILIEAKEEATTRLALVGIHCDNDMFAYFEQKQNEKEKKQKKNKEEDEYEEEVNPTDDSDEGEHAQNKMKEEDKELTEAECYDLLEKYCSPYIQETPLDDGKPNSFFNNIIFL